MTKLINSKQFDEHSSHDLYWFVGGETNHPLGCFDCQILFEETKEFLKKFGERFL